MAEDAGVEVDPQLALAPQHVVVTNRNGAVPTQLLQSRLETPLAADRLALADFIARRRVQSAQPVARVQIHAKRANVLLLQRYVVMVAEKVEVVVDNIQRKPQRLHADDIAGETLR